MSSSLTQPKIKQFDLWPVVEEWCLNGDERVVNLLKVSLNVIRNEAVTLFMFLPFGY